MMDSGHTRGQLTNGHQTVRSRHQLKAVFALAAMLTTTAGLVVAAHPVRAAAAPVAVDAPVNAAPVNAAPAAQAARVPNVTPAATDLAGGYHALTPARILDTRELLGIAGPLDEGESADLQVTGVGGVPASGVSAVVLNVTATNSSGETYVTAWPAGTDRPLASNLNVVADRDVPNLVIVPVGVGASAGKISLYNNHGSVDLVADAEGWFASGSDYHPMSPTRIMDTRLGIGVASTVHEQAVVDLQVTGQGGVPADGVGAVVLNLTATNPTSNTYVTAWPAGIARPVASNINVVTGQTSPNLIIVPVGNGGRVSLFNNAGDIDLIADVQGWFPVDATYTALTPMRILDTREGLGVAAPLGAASSADLQVTGQGGVPVAGVAAVVLNVTATNPTASTYVTVWPAGVAQPVASNLNVVAGETRPNLVVVPVSGDGKVSLYNNSGTTDLVADVQGWFPTTPTEVDPPNDPPADPPTAHWAIRPASVLVAPGQQRVVDLVPVDEHNAVRDGEFDPVTVEFAASGSGVTYEYIGNDQIAITAGAAPTSVLLGVTVDGTGPAIPLSISVVNLQPGVVQLPDETLVFPAPYVDEPDEQAAALGALLADDGVAGFTIEEIRSRTKASVDGDPQILTMPDAHFPLILRGSPPAVGTIVVTAGGSGINGRVIEPAGLPTLERNGFSLVTVAMVALNELYLDLSYAITSEQMAAVGVPLRIDESALDVGTRSASGNPSVDLPGGVKCELTVGGPDVKIFPPTPALVPTLEAWADISAGLSGNFKFLFTITGKVNVGASLEFVAKAGGTCEVPLSPATNRVVTIPAGPLSALLSGNLVHQLLAEFGFTWKAGPKMSVGFNCDLGGTLAFGFERTGGIWKNLSGFTPIHTCPTLGGQLPHANGVPISLELTGAINFKLDVGALLGGRVTQVFQWLLDDPELGNFTLLIGKFGPKLTFNVENQDNVLTDEASSTKLTLTFAGSIALDLKNVAWVSKIFGANAGSLSVTLWEITPEIPLLTGFQAPASSGMEYAIGGESMQALAAGGTIFVEPGDAVVVKSTLDSSDSPVNVEGVYTQPLAGPFEKSDWWNETAGGAGVLQVQHTFTQADCDSMSDGQAGFDPVTFKIAGEAGSVSGWDLGAPVPVWGGKFTVQCVLGKMNFDPETIENFHDSAEATLESYGKSAVDWTVASKPDFISSVVPDHGTWPVNPDKDNKTQQSLTLLEITHPAGECYDGADGDVKITSENNRRGDATLHVVLPDPCYVKFDKESITGSGTAHLLTKGFGIEDFDVDANSVPDWLTVLPMSGQLPPAPINEQSITFGFTVDDREATCEVQLPNSATVIVNSESRGAATIKIIQPKVPRKSGDECEPLTGGGDGDPHMRTFDGGYWEGQVRGEYVYARTNPGALDDVEVRVRQQPTLADAIIYPVTSITATLVRAGEHTVEVYARDLDNQPVFPPHVLVDGESVQLTDGTSVEIAAGFSIVRNGARIEVNAPLVHVTMSVYGGIMDTRVSADQGAPLAGMLGTPNANLADDFVPNGSAGPGYTLFVIQQQGPEQRVFTDSWRIDVADTLFTQPYDGQEDENPPVDPESFLPFQQEAARLLANLDTICDVQAAIDNHLLDGLAYELAIGRTSKELAEYSCQYVVRGIATSGDSPIPGLEVTVRAPGLTTCTTTTGSDGRYQCVLVPDFDPDSAGEPPAPPPFTVTVEGRFPGAAAIITSGTDTFATRALVAGPALGAFVDLSIDPSLLPNLNVAGTMKAAGQPYPTPVPVVIRGFNSADQLMVELRQTVVPNPVDGSFEFTKVLPIGSTRATIVAEIGLPCCPSTEQPRVTPTGLGNGPNAVAFSFDHDPPVVTLSGTMTGLGGAGLAGPITITFETFNGNQQLAFQQVAVNPAAADGAYTTVPLVLPVATTRLVATAHVGVTAAEYVSTTVSPVPAGPQTRTLNVSYIPPALSVHGFLTKAGAALTAPIGLTVTTYNTGGGILGTFFPTITSIDPSTGEYTVPAFAVPLDTTKVRVHAHLGIVETDFTTRELTPITTGVNTVEMSFDFNPPLVTVTGTVTKNGAAFTQQFGVELRSYYGVDLKQQQAFVTPDGSGHYAATFESPMGTTRLVAIAQIGQLTSEYTISPDVTTVVPGAQDLLLNVTYDAPVITVSGTLIDAAGAALPAGQRIAIRAFDDVAGTHQIFATNMSVDPNPGTGQYTATFTLPKSTKAVIATANIGPLSDPVPSALTAVVVGNGNALTLNAVYDPVVLGLSGTMTQPGGQPYTTPQLFQIVAKDIDGVVLSSAFWNANPNGSGFYDNIDVTLAMATRTVVITPRVGASANWVVVTKSVVPGINEFTLDVIQNVPRLVIAGTMNRNGAPLVGTVPLRIDALAANGITVLQTYNVVATPVDGSYSVTVDATVTTAQARVTADLSPFAADDVSQTFTGIVTGVNELAFSIDDTAKRLYLTGTVTVDGQPYFGSLQFYANYGHGTSPHVQDALKDYNIATNAGGEYVFDQLIPDATTDVGVTAYVPTGFGSSTAPVSFDKSGLTLLSNVDEFDINYESNKLALSGTITVDGAAPVGTVPILLSILTDNNQTFTKTVQVDPDDTTGHYQVSVAEPFNAVSATATIQIGPSYDWFVSDPITLSNVGDTPATLDAIYDPVYLTVTGRIRQLGVAADSITFRVAGLDENDQQIGLIVPNVTITPDATGAFDHVLIPTQYPRLAHSLSVIVTYHLTGEGAQTRQFSTGLLVADPPADETLTIDVDTQALHLSGRLVDGDGQPVLISNLVVSLDEFNVDIPLGGSGFLLSQSFDATFAFDSRPNVNATRVVLRIGTGAGLSIDLDPDHDTTIDIGDYTYVPDVELRVAGGFYDLTDPDTGEPVVLTSVRVVVTPYLFDEADFAEDPPYTHLGGPLEATVTEFDPDHPAEFLARIDLPAYTNLVDVQYFVNDDPVPYREGYFLDPNDQSPLVQYINYSEDHDQLIEVHTELGQNGDCNLQPAPYVLELTVTTYQFDAPWAGSATPFSGLIVPDPDGEPVVTIRIPVRAGFDRFDYVDDTSDIYSDSTMSWGGGSSGDLDPEGPVAVFIGRGCILV